MTPIERVSIKGRALSTLGLGGHATMADIRSAYRHLAFENHPDRNNGDSEAFTAISEAYHYLVDNADDLGITPIPAKPRRVSRPAIQAVETQFSEDTLAECQASLADTTDASQHVSTQLYRKGRNLTYFVPTAMAQGENQVALPTGELIDGRRAHARVISVNTRDTSAGLYEVPAHLCAQHFPGARSVQIRFAG